MRRSGRALALAVSALGWLQVQRSEGTRAGGRLALWGLALSAFFGLTYGAYLLASFAALRQQAEALDPYATFRSLYRQHRRAQIEETKSDKRSTPPNWYSAPPTQ